MPRWFAAAVASHLLTACLLALSVRPGAAQQPPRAAKQVSLSSLTAQGFEVKAAAGTQSGVDLSIQPTAFECWPVK